jgi:para-aminobenzoate synthetase component 1
MTVEGETVRYQVGGGIVADSDPRLEYEETLHKGRALRALLIDSTGAPS